MFRSALAGLGIQYAFLSLSNLLPILLFGYALGWDESDQRRSLGERVLQGLVVPSMAGRDFRRLPFTWPLPALYINGVAVGVAWIFNLLGFAVTARYNEGMLIGVVGVAIWFVVAFDV